MRWLTFALFMGVVLAVDALVHWYVYTRLFRTPEWSPLVKTIGGYSVLALAIGLPAGMFLARVLPRKMSGFIAGVCFVWMGTVFYLTVTLFAADLVRWLVAGGTAIIAYFTSGDRAPADPARRELLSQTTALAAGVATVGIAGTALRSGLSEVEVKEVGVVLPRLPPALSGLTIVQLTDIHIGSLLGARFLSQVVEKTNALKPDVIAITGDLVDGPVSTLRQQIAPISKLQARYGVFFVTGNHEFYAGVAAWDTELRRLGLRVLRNERAEIGDGATIDIAGVDDPTAERFGIGAPSVAEAVRGRDPDRELVLLAHQPKSIFSAAEAGVGLQLSGHTHGGQLWPFSYVVGLTQPYLKGLYRHNEVTQIYVSPGTGFWGPPMRFLAPAEITKIVLSAD